MFDVCVSYAVEPASTNVHTQDLLSEVLRIIKPDGCLNLCEIVKDKKTKLPSLLKLSGFINVTEVYIYGFRVVHICFKKHILRL